MRGQANPLLLLFLCAAIAAVARKRDFQAGMWLAGAICLKIFPAFLLIYPVWRRNGRLLAGCFAGLAVGLIFIPLLVFGPAQTWRHYQKLANVLVAPGLGLDTDQSRADELTYVTSTDSQSILATMHNTFHADRATRPSQASTAVRMASWAIGGCLTIATLWAAGRGKPRSATSEAAFFGLLIIVMLLLCPVCHLHYFSFALPLVMAPLAARWQGGETLQVGAGMAVLFIVNAIGNAIPNMWWMEIPRDLGLAMYATLALWCSGVILVWRQRQGKFPGSAKSGNPHGLAA
jgi:alpha-1,2-mannosyltransferase